MQFPSLTDRDAAAMNDAMSFMARVLPAPSRNGERATGTYPDFYACVAAAKQAGASEGEVRSWAESTRRGYAEYTWETAGLNADNPVAVVIAMAKKHGYVPEGLAGPARERKDWCRRCGTRRFASDLQAGLCASCRREDIAPMDTKAPAAFAALAQESAKPKSEVETALDRVLALARARNLDEAMRGLLAMDPNGPGWTPEERERHRSGLEQVGGLMRKKNGQAVSDNPLVAYAQSLGGVIVESWPEQPGEFDPPGAPKPEPKAPAVKPEQPELSLEGMSETRRDQILGVTAPEGDRQCGLCRVYMDASIPEGRPCYACVPHGSDWTWKDGFLPKGKARRQAVLDPGEFGLAACDGCRHEFAMSERNVADLEDDPARSLLCPFCEPAATPAEQLTALFG